MRVTAVVAVRRRREAGEVAAAMAAEAEVAVVETAFCCEVTIWASLLQAASVEARNGRPPRSPCWQVDCCWVEGH